MVLLLFLVVAAAAYAGIAGADPVWVIGAVAAVALAGWLLVGVVEVARGARKRVVREGPSVYPGQVLVARVAVWWLACCLAHAPAVVAAMARRPQVLPDRSPATWVRSAPSRHRRHR